jgi:hypothetical protein
VNVNNQGPEVKSVDGNVTFAENSREKFRVATRPEAGRAIPHRGEVEAWTQVLIGAEPEERGVAEAVTKRTAWFRPASKPVAEHQRVMTALIASATDENEPSLESVRESPLSALALDCVVERDAPPAGSTTRPS